VTLKIFLDAPPTSGAFAFVAAKGKLHKPILSACC
jgi:hypothetical protein